VFGWGERKRQFMLVPGEYTSWPTGVEKDVDEGQKGFNTYGDHPFVLARLEDKTYIGLFLKNSNAKVLKYIKEPKGKSVINFRMIGGVIDIFAFMGTTVEEVLQEYHKVVGHPFLPPLWAFGFHQGSSGYTSDKLARESVEKYRNMSIPLEALWIDESYMQNYRPFTLDKENFGNLRILASDLAQKKQRIGISIHPGIPTTDEKGNPYSYYESLVKEGGYIKTLKTTDKYKDVLIGEHLPGKCAYIDFSSPDGARFWLEGLKTLTDITSYQSIQFNYNEITQM